MFQGQKESSFSWAKADSWWMWMWMLVGWASVGATSTPFTVIMFWVMLPLLSAGRWHTTEQGWEKLIRSREDLLAGGRQKNRRKPEGEGLAFSVTTSQKTAGAKGPF